MRKSKYKKQIASLLKKPIFTVEDARIRKVPSRMLAHFCRTGLIERMSRGIYRVIQAPSGMSGELEELVLTAQSIPHGVICLISALSYYNLTDQVMRKYWIAIPNSQKSPKRPHTRIIRMRNMTLGIVTVRIGKYRAKIFDRERAVIDAFRYLDQEVAIKALKAYLSASANKKADLPKLIKYAKTLRVNIHSYIMALSI